MSNRAAVAISLALAMSRIVGASDWPQLRGPGGLASGTFVLAAKPQFEQRAHNQFQSDDSDFNATPAISDGRLFLRSNRFLYCVTSD